MLGINSQKCLICLESSNQSQQTDDSGKSFFAGKQVKLDCKCKNYFHAKCLHTHLNNTLAVPAPQNFTASVLTAIRSAGSSPDDVLESDAAANAKLTNYCVTCKEVPKTYMVFNGDAKLNPPETKEIASLGDEFSAETEEETKRLIKMNEMMNSFRNIDLNAGLTFSRGKAFSSLAPKK